MRQRIGTFFCLFIWVSFTSSLIYGQEVNTLDTIGRKMRYVGIDHPMWLEQLVEPRYSDIRLGYGVEKGGYRTAQQADRIRQIGFKSEGSVTIKDVRLWGNFSYRNAMEDSTRFGHQTRHNPQAPFYFASYGANHYERTDYRIQVRGQRYFNNKKWSLFGGVDYVLGDHFSNNDPRGSIDVFQVDGSLGVGYELAADWQIGIEGAYGYGQEAVEVAYRNDQYALQAIESPYLNYTVYGYGWRVQDWLLDKGLHYQTNMKRPAMKGYVSHTVGKSRLYAYMEYENERHSYEQVLWNESRKNDLTAYESDAFDYGVQWHMKKDNRQFYLYFQGLNKRGKDKLPAEWNGLNNYVYQSDRYHVLGAYSRQHDRWQYDYESGFVYNQERKYDGGSGTLLDYMRINTELSFMITRITAKKQHLQVGIAALANFTPTLQWELPQINENIFHRYVFYHDVNYYQTNNYGGAVNLGFRQLINGGRFLHWSLRYQSVLANGFVPMQNIYDAYPANERSQLNISMAYGF